MFFVGVVQTAPVRVQTVPVCKARIGRKRRKRRKSLMIVIVETGMRILTLAAIASTGDFYRHKFPTVIESIDIIAAMLKAPIHEAGL